MLPWKRIKRQQFNNPIWIWPFDNNEEKQIIGRARQMLVTQIEIEGEKELEKIIENVRVFAKVWEDHYDLGQMARRECKAHNVPCDKWTCKMFP